jgi:hypothetical protein
MENSKNPIETYEFFANPNYEEFVITDERRIGKTSTPIKSNRSKRREEARKKKNK